MANYNGTPGNDTYSGNTENDVINGQGGNDLLNGNAGNDSVYGNTGNDTLTAGNGTDTLDGGTGADSMSGGNQNDLYIVDDLGDTANEVTSSLAAGGTDLVKSSVSFTLGDYVENLTITSSVGRLGVGNSFSVYQVLTGGTGNDTLMGLDNFDTLDGGAGADSLVGGNGNDYYKVDNAGDKVLEESSSGGLDVVASSVSFTLGSYVDTLLLSGGTLSGTGSAQANTINGTSSANTLKGMGGDDTLTGNGGNDNLSGAGGNDVLNGGEGNDTLNGGAGNDSYTVDVAADKITDGGGTSDSVTAYFTYTLADNLEHLTLAGTDSINGTGNASANSIAGNEGANTLKGLGGNDTIHGWQDSDNLAGAGGNDSLFGYTGGDTLAGAAGNDTLDGGVGIDRLNGGAGNDLYRVDDAGDVVIESSETGGTDTVEASVDYTLGANLEHLTLTGTGDIDGAGNDESNELTGNSGANVLAGGAGSDLVNGMDGNDVLVFAAEFTYGAGSPTQNVFSGEEVDLAGLKGSLDDYRGGNGTDTLLGSEAGDGIVLHYSLAAYRIFTDIEVFAGGNGNDLIDLTSPDYAVGASELYGEAGSDTLWGGAGDDLLDGGSGVDRLTGGNGNDVLVWDSADTSVSGGNGEDTLRVDGADAEVTLTGVFSGIEVVDLTGVGANELLLAAGDLSGDLYVTGDGDDTIQLQDAGWVEGTEAGGYVPWTNGEVTLYALAGVDVLETAT